MRIEKYGRTASSLGIVNVLDRTYESMEIINHAGKRVLCHPLDDSSVVVVYTEEGKFICTAKERTKTPYLPVKKEANQAGQKKIFISIGDHHYVSQIELTSWYAVSIVRPANGDRPYLNIHSESGKVMAKTALTTMRVNPHHSGGES